MPRKDEEVKLQGRIPQEHKVIYKAKSGRAKYPFKSMVIGDYFLIEEVEGALATRSALKSFYNRFKNRRFTVRMKIENDNVWVCRRVE